ncbi:uncharacterized protein PFL1_02136 [Pseudozyma flocculosa PF-1]|uniref:uncharacterized protein n=1 Tax=Pseudozyma flocculosa PF-1 TaxID=1277687 RepID=UPI0004560D34|nr:uncharacterized protein PFL1_02136 [Pseudozyma flocculosa PF-1]EPQ30612.1 hypothetical protein PFL1_02136 [Pseudozyma flocculosa PF-1]
MSATSAVPTPASSPNKPRPKGKDAAATTTAATTSQPGPVPSMTAAIVGARSPAKKPRASPSKRSKVGASMSASPIASTSQLTLQSNEPHAALDLAHILSTPRRGRRVGRIDMGWESPLADADRDGPTLSCPHTLPKASRVRKAFYDQDDLPETPSKRKASRAFAKDSTRPQRSLVDTHGWASAAMVSKVPLPDFSASPGFSPRPATTTPKGTGAPASDDRLDAEGLWSHFESPAAPTTPRLVPLEVAGLGRVAVHREFAGQIAEQAPYNNSSKPSTAIRRHGSFCSDYASGVSDASGTGSSLGTSTNPTSVGTPCPSGVSPSFSLCSQFPPSEPESPYKQANAKQVAAQKESQAQAQAHAHGSFSISPSSKAVSVIATASLLDNALYRPKLGGSHSVLQAGLPTLEWPDGPDGPWAAAGQHIDHLKQQRKEGVQKWLETDLDEESAAGTLEAAGSKHVHHPMVAKALLDRARKQGRQILAAVSASQTSPTKRSRGSKHKKKASRGGSNATPSRRKQEPLGTASSVTDTPSSRRSVATAASLARSDHSAIRGCKCGIEDESVVMVQCDHCRRWLHLPCVGIADIDELDDEWYCDECCERAINDHLSPASSLPATITSFADLSTPEGLQAAINMCEPVFALPSGTPIHRRGVALSSSIALAPSPPMLSVGQQTSGFAGATPSSSSLLRTPELQPRRPSTSSLRGSRYDFDDPPTSSSPFPRTPTFDTGSPRYGGPSDRSAGRHHPPLGLGLPPPASSSRLSKHSSGAAGPATTTALSSSYSANSVDLKDRVIGGGGGPPASTGKARQVSSEMPFGLGIGFDLDEVLDWS